MKKGDATWIYIELVPMTKIAHNRAVARMVRGYLGVKDVSKYPKLAYVQNESGTEKVNRLENHLKELDTLIPIEIVD